MSKVYYRIPPKELDGLPIVPKGTIEVLYTESDGKASSLVFQTQEGSVEVDDSYTLTKYRQEKDIFGAIAASGDQHIGPSKWEEAVKRCQDYIRSVKRT